MTELRKWFGPLKDILTKEAKSANKFVDANSPEAQDIKLQIDEAMKLEKFYDVQRLVVEITPTQQEFDADLQDLVDRYNTLLNKYNIGNRRVPFSALLAYEERSEEEFRVASWEKEHKRYGKKEPWVAHSKPLSLREWIKIDEKTEEFVHKNHKNITMLITPENRRNDISRLREASDQLSRYKNEFCNALRDESKTLKAKNVKDLFESHLRITKVQEWKDLYEYSIKHFGTLSIEDFDKKVIRRPVVRERLLDQEQKVEAVQKPRPTKTIEVGKPVPEVRKRGKKEPFVFLKPREVFSESNNRTSTEITLANKLLKSGMIEKIKKNVFRDTETIPVYWNEESVEDSLRRSADLRYGEPITKFDQPKVDDLIKKSIKTLSVMHLNGGKDSQLRGPWGRDIQKYDLTGWKIIFDMTGKITNIDQAYKLCETLFAVPSGSADARESFFLKELTIIS